MEPASLQLEAAKVLSLLSRAQVVYGGDQEPAAPPEVKAARAYAKAREKQAALEAFFSNAREIELLAGAGTR